MKTLLIATLLVSTQAFAWGPTGHRVVGEVAEKFLEPSVKLKVHKILQGSTLARVANWPDEIKSDPTNYSSTYNWHYTDWADEAHDHDETNSSGKLLTSISEQLKVLKDSASAEDKKLFALKFIIHLVGDLHMPLHVGNGLDQGGNACKVIFHKQVTNLHALWDEGMIDFTKLSFSEMAKFIAQGKTLPEVAAWRKGDVLDWARESKELRAQIYPDNVVPTPGPQSSRTYCRMDVPVQESEMPKLSYDYSYKFIPVVEKRLFQAGLRLAVLLNSNL
jgi:S1/P1 Nuclease